MTGYLAYCVVFVVRSLLYKSYTTPRMLCTIVTDAVATAHWLRCSVATFIQRGSNYLC